MQKSLWCWGRGGISDALLVPEGRVECEVAGGLAAAPGARAVRSRRRRPAPPHARCRLVPWVPAGHLGAGWSPGRRLVPWALAGAHVKLQVPLKFQTQTTWREMSARVGHPETPVRQLRLSRPVAPHLPLTPTREWTFPANTFCTECSFMVSFPILKADKQKQLHT